MKKIYIFILFAMLLPCLTVNGQALRSSYFMENSLFRSKMNPAFTPRSNYFSLPLLAGFGAGINSNLGISDFLYPKNGTLYTYMNENVTLEEFSGNLPRKPYIDIDIDTDILNFGFYTGRNAFWTFDIGLKVDAQIDMPKDLFLFTKQGMASSVQKYNIGGFNIYQTSAFQIALGHARNLSDILKGLSVGVKAKFLVGIEHIGMRINNADIYMSKDKWMLDTDASGNIAASFLNVTMPQGDQEAVYDFNSQNIAPSGYGFAVDFGAEYRLSIGSFLDGLTLSASVVDLGAMFYGPKNMQTFVSSGAAEFNGFEGINLDDYNFEQNLQEITDEFVNLANLTEVEPTERIRVSTGPKIYLGAEMPFLKNIMSLGLLYTARFGYARTANELTVAYNLTPAKWFNLGINYSFLNTAKSIGWIVELSPKAGVDLFIGSDYTYLEFTPQFVPVEKFCINARMGMAIVLGSKYGR